MGFFDDDDPFESIVREFFQEARPRTSSSRNFLSSEKEERVIDYIEEGDTIYFVFELSGYNEEDIKVEVRDGVVEVFAKKKGFENVQDYLISKLKKGMSIKKEVPGLKVKKYGWTFKNGILEVKIKTK